MFSGQMSAHSLNILKRKWHTTSSLKTGLLKDEPPEIELSDYHKAPSPHSESPSGLLDGETSNLEPIEDLDLFIERIYTYYCGKGLWRIIIKWIFELLTLFFIICFSGFFLLYVDWNGLCNAKCGMDAVESGIRPCDLSEEALHKHPLTPLTLSKVIILGYLGIFSVYWIFCFLKFFAQLKEILMIRRFYYDSLHITENQIQTMPWALVLEKVIEVQHSQRLCLVKDLSIHDVVMRLMRKENYLIGMVNKGVLAFPISGWVPGAGPTVRVGQNVVQHRLVLTKTLEWILNLCILQSMFDRNFCLRREFVSDPKTLRKRLMIVGLAMLLLSPFLVIFMLVYLFLRHAEQFYNHPSTASHRRWSNLCKWMFREFNEVDHLFKHRINNSLVHASNYLKQFPSPILTIVAKFISFVSGGFAAVLIIIAFLEESLLEGHIFGRNLFWYAAVFGAITAVSRAAVVDELLVLDPQGAMSLVVEHTHYMPKRWRGKENTETVRLELETLFQYSGMTLLEEMASIFVTPYLLLFVVPKRVDDILQFIVDFTIDVEGVGHVCCFSAFNFENHGNSKYGSPFNSPRSKRSSQGKMEKSTLSFQITYPRWEPDAHGKQFLASLKAFRDQKLQARQQTTMNHSALVPLSSMWLIDGEQHKNYPYILDWYYTSQNHNTFSAVEESPIDTYTDEANWRYYTSQNQSTFSTVESPIDTYTDEANWRYFEEPSHLEASTSNPHDSRNGECGTHWWARRQPEGVQVETSFLDPPNFFGNAPYDNSSDRSAEDQECSEWRYHKRPSEKFFMDDLDSREFCLPFDDIYSSRPLEIPTENAAPVNLV